MMGMRDWLSRNLHRPVLVAISVVTLLQLIAAVSLTAREWKARGDSADHLAESITLCIQQHNRPLLESTALGALHSGRFASIALCRDGIADLAYPPSLLDACSRERTIGRSLSIKRELAGAPGHHLDLRLDVFGLLLPILSLLTVSIGLLAIVGAILNRSWRKFRMDVLGPLSTGLNSTTPLGIEELDILRRRNIEFQDLNSRQAATKAIMELSAQVAHDIRAPLAALISAGTSNPVSRAAIARIEGIAEALLFRERTIRKGINAVSLPTILQQVFREARLRARPQVFLDFPAHDSPGAYVLANSDEIQRIASNLVGNAMESIRDSGHVSVSIQTLDLFVVLQIADTGGGIASNILPRLGERGATFGKAGGTGLGLWHAKTTVESWGGRLEIESEVGKGTIIRLFLPRAEPPPAVQTDHPPSAILIDDDPLVRMNWMVAAKRAGATLAAYPTAAAFIEGGRDCPKDTPVYIDSDLGEGIKGEEAAMNLRSLGFTELHLATGHDPASFPALPHLKSIRGKEPPWPLA